MSSKQRSAGSSGPERGSAIADFVLVSALTALLCAAIFQLAFALHVRNTLIDSAGEGARHAALSGSTLGAGVDRTRDLITAALPARFAADISARVTDLDGIEIIEVNVLSPLPLLGLLGPQVVHSTGRAIVE